MYKIIMTFKYYTSICLNKLEILKDKFCEHFFRYSIFIVMFSFILYLIVKLATYFPNAGFLEIYTEATEQIILVKGISISNWQLIFSILVLIITAIWAMYQYDKSVKYKQQEKGSAIAKDFAVELIDKITIIENVFRMYPNLQKIISKLSSYETLNFNSYDLKKILSDTEIKDYNTFMSEGKADEFYTEYLNKNFSISYIENLPKDFESFVLQVLNNLEYKCMDISSTVAGSQFIYPSLHTAFINLIQKCYILISQYNNTNMDLFYVNVSLVYNSWIIQRNKDVKKYKNAKNKLDKKTNKLNKKIEYEIKKLLNQKPNRV